MRRTLSPNDSAMLFDPSLEPSSTTTTSSGSHVCCSALSIACPSHCSALKQGIATLTSGIIWLLLEPAAKTEDPHSDGRREIELDVRLFDGFASLILPGTFS